MGIFSIYKYCEEDASVFNNNEHDIQTVSLDTKNMIDFLFELFNDTKLIFLALNTNEEIIGVYRFPSHEKMIELLECDSNFLVSGFKNENNYFLEKK